MAGRRSSSGDDDGDGDLLETSEAPAGRLIPLLTLPKKEREEVVGLTVACSGDKS